LTSLGRKTLAAPLRTSFLRELSTETETIVNDTEAIASSVENHGKETSSIESNINRLRMNQRFVTTKLEDNSAEALADYNLRRTIKKRTHGLGSIIAPHYEPMDLLLNPPRPQDVTLELLMASQSHLGHHTSVWNPMNQKYIYGVRAGIHIISLEETAAHLRRSAKIIEGVAYHGGLILFVGNRKGHAPAVVKAATMAGGCHLFYRWIPGTLTNGNQILRKCDIMAVDKDDKKVDGFEEKIAEWRALKPDLVVCFNPMENYLLLHECSYNNIPTMAVIDTNADPTWVTYPIPANDDRYNLTVYHSPSYIC
jgi:small subunit ribosomal protein S2